MANDPRDKGFNYSTGWGSDPKPPLYLEAMKKAQELNRVASEASKEAWEMEHALWVVRIATTGVEKAIALSHVADKMAKYHNQAEAA